MAGSSTIGELPRQHQVFINFRGEELVYDFVRDLAKVLKINKISVLICRNKGSLEELEIQLKRIEDSKIALVFFSGRYSESTWCFRELTMIADWVKKGKLVAIPIFYKLDPSTVKGLKGRFGDAFRDLRESDVTKEIWKEALKSITNTTKGIIVDMKSNQSEEVERIVGEVKSVLKEIQWKSLSAPLETTENSGITKIRMLLGMMIGCLLLLIVVWLQHIVHRNTPLIECGTIDRIVPKVLEYIPAVRTENPKDKDTDVPTCIFGADPERSSCAKTNADFLDRTCSSYPMDSNVKPPEIQVFINFRGEQLRNNFVGYLVDALRKSGINIFIDTKANIGDELNNLFKRIEDSGIAIVVFSSRYTESEWCLNELVKIKERAHQGLLKVLPIFYKVTPGNVKRLKGEFGDNFRDKEYMYASDEPKIKRWKEAIVFVSHKFALTFDAKRVLEIDFIETIVKEVLKMLQAISTVENGQSSH